MLTIIIKRVLCECGHRPSLAPYQLREIRNGERFVMCMICETRQKIIENEERIRELLREYDRD